MANTRRGWSWRARRRAARGGLIIVAGSVCLLGTGVPARAAPTGALYLDGLFAVTTIGAPVGFTASLTNDGSESVSRIRLVLRVTATGVEPQGVYIERRELDGTWTSVVTRTGNKGDVRFVDDGYRDRVMAPGGAMTGRYRLTFLAGTPPGLAIISVNADHRTDAGWQTFADSPQYLTRAVPPGDPAGGGGMAGSPAATAAVMSSPSVISSEDMLSVAVATGASASDVLPASRPQRGSSRVLTLAGIGVALMLLLTAVWALRRQVDGGPGHGRRSDSDDQWSRRM